jgi:hypothetical protein
MMTSLPMIQRDNIRPQGENSTDKHHNVLRIQKQVQCKGKTGAIIPGYACCLCLLPSLSR